MENFRFASFLGFFTPLRLFFFSVAFFSSTTPLWAIRNPPPSEFSPLNAAGPLLSQAQPHLPIAAQQTLPDSPMPKRAHDAKPPAPFDSFKHMLHSAVRVDVIEMKYPYYTMKTPWRQPRQSESFTMSGSVIRHKGKNYILSGLAPFFASGLLVRMQGTSKGYVAKLAACSIMRSLSLLTVDDPKFWQSTEPFEFDEEIPEGGKDVQLYGFPNLIRDTELVLTTGHINRLLVDNILPQVLSVGERTWLPLHAVTLHDELPRMLMLQTDLFSNMGDNGGPAVSKEGKLVGVALIPWMTNDLTSFLIPVPVIKSFLSDFDRNGKNLQGPPILGALFESTVENPMLAKYYGLNNVEEVRRKMAAKKFKHQFAKDFNPRGLKVTSVDKTWFKTQQMHRNDTSHIGLQEGDILLQINGKDIAYDGTITFRANQRLPWAYALDGYSVGDDAEAVVWRDGEFREILVPLPPLNRTIVPKARFFKPNYFFYGGLLFTRNDPLVTKEQPAEVPYKKREGDEIVTVAKVFATQATVGMEAAQRKKLLRVDGKKVRNLEDVVRAVEGHGARQKVRFHAGQDDDELIKFDFKDNFVFFMNRTEVENQKDELLKQLFMPTDRYLHHEGPLCLQ